jgi:hypothetical protein
MRFLLGSAALAGILVAAPTLAQQNYYHTNPTPEERAQTNALNGQAAQDARQPAEPVAPVAPATSDPDYRAKMDAYNRDMAAFAERRAAYERARADYRDARDGGSDPWRAFDGYRALRPVAFMPTESLMDRDVRGRDGAFMGRTQRVERNLSGSVNRVLLRMPGRRTAWLDARDLRLDPARAVLVTDLTRGELAGMVRERAPGS